MRFAFHFSIDEKLDIRWFCRLDTFLKKQLSWVAVTVVNSFVIGSFSETCDVMRIATLIVIQIVVLPHFFINEIYNLFPCNIASSEHLGSWENIREPLGNHSAAPRRFATELACSSRVFRWGYTVLHGNAFTFSGKLASGKRVTRVHGATFPM